jgi:hypothetical protein
MDLVKFRGIFLKPHEISSCAEGHAGQEGTYHSVHRHVLDQSIVEYLSQVCSFALADVGEVVEKWAVIQRELSLHLVNPVDKVLLITTPELANVEKVAMFLSECLDPFFGEALGKVLYGVKSEASETRNFVDNPFTPVCDVLTDLRVRVIQVGKHEEIGITALVVDSLTPPLVITLDLENRILASRSIIIRTSEMVPVILLLGVLVTSAVKVEA